MSNSYKEFKQEQERLFGPDVPAQAPTVPDSLVDTVCTCTHWFEEHDGNGSCLMYGCKCKQFTYCDMFTRQRKGTWNE